MRAIITNSYYTLNPFQIHWNGRCENGEKLHYSFTPPFKPYFYYEDKGKIIKKETNIPSEVANERDILQAQGIKTYEADIVFPERVLIDLGIQKGVEINNLNIDDMSPNNYRPCDYKGISLRKFYIDIETDDTKPMNINNPKGEVLSISIRDSIKPVSSFLTTIPREKVNPMLLAQTIHEENEKIRYALRDKHLDYLLPFVKDMDLKFVSFKTEREMIDRYRRLLYSGNYADLNVGYNINGFDLPYLQNSGTKYKMNMGYRVMGVGEETSVSHQQVTNFDLYRAYKRLQENDLDSFSLESVSMRELGIGKIHHKEGFREMYETQPEKFIAYNYRDTLLCHLLDLKLGIYDFFLMLSAKTGTLDSGRWNATYLIDTLLFRRSHNTDFYIPTHSQQKKIEVEGGKVLEAKTGIYKNVVVLDFKHEYPNQIIQFNLSQDTLLLDDQITPDDIYIGEFNGHKVGFRKDKIGIIPKTIQEIVTERYEVKSRMKKEPVGSDAYNMLNNEQRSLKEIDNSFYGITGSVNARLFSPYIQASITFLARSHLKFVSDYIEKLNETRKYRIEILYGDTDSIFIHCNAWEGMETDDVIAEVKSLTKKINEQFVDFVKMFNGNTDKVVLEMEFEKLYSGWEQYGGKKQYAGYIVWKDGKYLNDRLWDVKGFDPRRSDKSIYQSSYFMDKMLKYPLEDVGKAIEFYEEENKKWDSHAIDPEIIGIYFTLNQETYKHERMEKRAYEHAIERGIKLDRMKGKYRMYFLKLPRPNDVIAINYDSPVPEFVKKNLDWSYHKKRCFLNRAEEIINYLRTQVDSGYEVEE